jgi:hypothetical protein
MIREVEAKDEIKMAIMSSRLDSMEWTNAIEDILPIYSPYSYP